MTTKKFNLHDYTAIKSDLLITSVEKKNALISQCKQIAACCQLRVQQMAISLVCVKNFLRKTNKSFSLFELFCIVLNIHVNDYDIIKNLTTVST